MFKKILATLVGVVVSGGIALADDNNTDAPQANGPVVFEAQMVQGEIFAMPVPQGWAHSEGTNETFITAPDQSMGIGFSGLEAIGACNPTQFLTYMATTVYKVPNFRILEAHAVQYPGGQAIEAIYTATATNGRPVKAWARVVVTRGYGYNGYMLFASAYADRFDQVADGLKCMADKIQITNQNLVFQRSTRMAVQANTNLNHPMDHSFADAYWKQQKTYERVYARDSDVRRDSYVSTDPHTGQRYYHDGSAYDSNGRVINPNHPNEYLTPERHWQNR